MRRIYLDYAATTPVDPEVMREMKPYFSEKFGNPGAIHQLGQEAFRAVSCARGIVAKAFGCVSEGVIFTASATEANNLAIQGMIAEARSASRSTSSSRSSGGTALALGAAARLRRDQVRDASESLLESPRASAFVLPHIITTAIEHDSVLEVCRALEREGLAEVTYVRVSPEGIVDFVDITKALRPETALVSVMYANNEIGTIQPIAEIAKLIAEFRKQKVENSDAFNSKFYFLDSRYPLFHVDAVQSAQFLDCDMERLGIDLMTISSHKIYGPKGAAALLMKKIENRNEKTWNDRRLISPLVVGGGQERGVRSGTENVPVIVGFGKAVDMAFASRDKEAKRLRKLRDYFIERLAAFNKGVSLNGSAVFRLPNNVNVSFSDVPSDVMLTALDRQGVAASAGSSCEARAAKPSHVLKAIGISDEARKFSVRFSLGKYTTKPDIDYVIRVVAKIILAV